MKEWKKPEIVDLDVKIYRKCTIYYIRRSSTVPEPEVPKPTCDECEKELIDLANFHNENNHKIGVVTLNRENQLVEDSFRY